MNTESTCRTTDPLRLVPSVLTVVVSILIAWPLHAQDPKPMGDSIQVRSGPVIAPPARIQLPATITNQARVPAKLPLDQALLNALASSQSESYRVYRVESRRGESEVWRKDWYGVMFLPNVTRTGELERIWFRDRSRRPIHYESGEVFTDWYYRLPAESYSKRLLDATDAPAGLMTLTSDGSHVISLDLDQDRRVDLLSVQAPNGIEYLIVDNNNGLNALDQWWRQGIHPLCVSVEGRGGGIGAMSREQRSDVRAVLRACGTDGGLSGGTGSGGLWGGARAGSEGNSFDDMMDDTCKAILPRPGARPGMGTVMSDVGGLFSWFLGKAVDAAAEAAKVTRWANAVGAFIAASEANSTQAYPCELGGSGACGELAARRAKAAELEAQEQRAESMERAQRDFEETELYEMLGESGESETDEEESARDVDGDGAPDPSDDPNAGGGGETGQPGDPLAPESFEEVMYEYCKARAEADWRYPDSIEDLERRWVKERCQDPKSQPSPGAIMAAEGGELSTWCERDEDAGRTRADASNLREIFGGGSGSECGPLEQPGPDGECSGIGVRTGSGADPAVGSFEMGLGLVIPLGCAGRPNCDPSEVP